MKINDVEFNAELSEILDELRTQLTINQIPLLQKIKDSGYDIMVQCPYHGNGQERRPSAGIRKSDGTFHCFACNETHTLPEVISHCFGKDAVGSFGWKWLLQNYGTVSVEERKDVVLDYTRHTNDSDTVIYGIDSYSGVSDSNSDSAVQRFVSEEELDKYKYFHPYMYKRGLTDEIIQLFDIGYDHNSDCLTFPVRDICGRCLFVARRSVRTKYFSYPKGVEKPLYGLYELYKYGMSSSIGGRGSWKSYPMFTEVIVCESMLDALSFWTVGKYAVALNGLGNELQFEQLRRLPCRKLILATDSDEAGMKARQRIRNNIKNKIITEYMFPKGRKDANECTKDELLNLEEIF